MSNLELVHKLVQTRINGNKIIGNDFYERILNRVKKIDILEYGNCYEIELDSKHSKIDLIEQIRNY